MRTKIRITCSMLSPPFRQW